MDPAFRDDVSHTDVDDFLTDATDAFLVKTVDAAGVERLVGVAHIVEVVNT